VPAVPCAASLRCSRTAAAGSLRHMEPSPNRAVGAVTVLLTPLPLLLAGVTAGKTYEVFLDSAGVAISLKKTPVVLPVLSDLFFNHFTALLWALFALGAVFSAASFAAFARNRGGAGAIAGAQPGQFALLGLALLFALLFLAGYTIALAGVFLAVAPAP